MPCVRSQTKYVSESPLTLCELSEVSAANPSCSRSTALPIACGANSASEGVKATPRQRIIAVSDQSSTQQQLATSAAAQQQKPCYRTHHCHRHHTGHRLWCSLPQALLCHLTPTVSGSLDFKSWCVFRLISAQHSSAPSFGMHNLPGYPP